MAILFKYMIFKGNNMKSQLILGVVIQCLLGFICVNASVLSAGDNIPDNYERDTSTVTNPLEKIAIYSVSNSNNAVIYANGKMQVGVRVAYRIKEESGYEIDSIKLRESITGANLSMWSVGPKNDYSHNLNTRSIRSYPHDIDPNSIIEGGYQDYYLSGKDIEDIQICVGINLVNHESKTYRFQTTCEESGIGESLNIDVLEPVQYSYDNLTHTITPAYDSFLECNGLSSVYHIYHEFKLSGGKKIWNAEIKDESGGSMRFPKKSDNISASDFNWFPHAMFRKRGGSNSHYSSFTSPHFDTALYALSAPENGKERGVIIPSLKILLLWVSRSGKINIPGECSLDSPSLNPNNSIVFSEIIGSPMLNSRTDVNYGGRVSQGFYHRNDIYVVFEDQYGNPGKFTISTTKTGRNYYSEFVQSWSGSNDNNLKVFNRFSN
ncbi:hypothetical protein A1QO_14130 [Vibrio genomosp. F10 str. ZF-129]|uniref:Uncharacterized protein n=1 Tax=Vibrio genomosp. F10 str. ZF-129 TaxID=1187848 RepID=A0A1E5BAY4_9VIBR|nr:hypothetical protein [Vibrio genomosp. F10]OEE31255.1 hypothetical protein A1QO_14130 [Vibrio genomosp. F10 str. ZF-129]